MAPLGGRIGRRGHEKPLECRLATSSPSRGCDLEGAVNGVVTLLKRLQPKNREDV